MLGSSAVAGDDLPAADQGFGQPLVVQVVDLLEVCSLELPRGDCRPVVGCEADQRSVWVDGEGDGDPSGDRLPGLRGRELGGEHDQQVHRGVARRLWVLGEHLPESVDLGAGAVGDLGVGEPVDAPVLPLALREIRDRRL
jgi:hypothetical protein